MNEDVERHTQEAIEAIAIWKKHMRDIATKASGSDLQENVTSGINSYGCVFAARYYLWILQKYMKIPSKFYSDANSYDKAEALIDELRSMEKDAWVLWDTAATKIKRELPAQEWKKYLDHLDKTNGSSKYAVDLGWI